jgi:hypothetical protein
MRKALNIPDSTIIQIVHEGAIAIHGIGEGRMIPVLVVDCSQKIELLDLIYAHKELPPGDVTVTWCMPKNDKNKVSLYLEFSKPSAVNALLQFDIEKQGGVVDGILHANALYLQPTESGKRVIDGLENEKILAEIPDTGFFPMWEKLYTETLIKVFKRYGFSRSEAKIATEQHKKMLRDIWVRRMKRD